MEDEKSFKFQIADETHLFDFDADMYGDEIQVEFLSYLRDERKFSGVEALLTQIRADVTAAKARLQALGH